jgi:predicted MFS family arabinose efflux permease
VPISSLLAASGGWAMVFWAAAILNLASAAMALLVLKPLRARLRLGLIKAELSTVAGVPAASAETT